MGLAICRQLVELMHGNIGLHSEPGQGTALWFDIPFKDATLASSPQAAEVAA